MELIHYNIAGHSFLLEAEMPERISSYLPSYLPFIINEVSENSVFKLTVSTSESKLYGAEVHRFVWEGAGYIIYQGEEGYSFCIFPSAASEPYLMRVDMNFSTASVFMRGDEKADAFVLNNCLMMLFAFATASLKTLMVHASVIRKDEKGFLFLGKSGTGKSTHSDLWAKFISGSELLNDDNPIVRMTDAGDVIVSGSPWSGKTSCYKNIQVPVGAIVKLSQAPENKIRKINSAHSFAELLPSCSAMRWDKRVYDGICDTVSKVAETVPFYALDCLPDGAAAELCHNTIVHG